MRTSAKAVETREEKEEAGRREEEEGRRKYDLIPLLRILRLA